MMGPSPVAMANRCRPVSLDLRRVKQKNLCDCGLAALEMVLRYYGASDDDVDFLPDRGIGQQVGKIGEGLSEGTIGTLALKRGFNVTIYGQKPRITKTFLTLGGRVVRVGTGKLLISRCLKRGVPPILLIPNVKEAYEKEQQSIPHYVVAQGVDRDCHVLVADPAYRAGPRQRYWNDWSSSLIVVEPREIRRIE